MCGDSIHKWTSDEERVWSDKKKRSKSPIRRVWERVEKLKYVHSVGGWLKATTQQKISKDILIYSECQFSMSSTWNRSHFLSLVVGAATQLWEKVSLVWICNVVRADGQDTNKKLYPGFSAQSIDNLIFASLSLHWRIKLLLTNMVERIRHINIGGSLICSDHALEEFTILRYMGQVKSRGRTSNFRRVNFQFLRN